MPEKVTKEERLAERISEFVVKAKEMLQEPTNEQLPLPSNEEEVERKDPKPMADDTKNLNQKKEGFGLGGEEVGSPVKKEQMSLRQLMDQYSKFRKEERENLLRMMKEHNERMKQMGK